MTVHITILWFIYQTQTVRKVNLKQLSFKDLLHQDVIGVKWVLHTADMSAHMVSKDF